MSIKSILVPLDGREESFQVLDTALVVANRFDASIRAIHVMPEESLPFQFDPLPARLKETVLAESEKRSRENAQGIEEQFRSFCVKHDIAVDETLTAGKRSAVWQVETGDITEVLIREARFCDVVATFRPRKLDARLRRSPAGENLEALLMRGGRPILLVPPKWTARKVSHAAIAWNESREASLALAMTMPWLRQMEEVSIIVARKRKATMPGLCEYLSLHGVNAKVKYLPSKIKSAGEAILQSCKENGVEFLVVGGFSHTRSRQLIFGGVTQHLLKNANVITVMVH